MPEITHPIFHDEAKARAHFEKLRWPDGPVCPHCGAFGESTAKVVRKIRKPRNPVAGKKHRPQRDGLYYCNSCTEQFSVMVGTVMERSHIPINKWLMGFVLMSGAKKGISAKQLQRHLQINYRSAWFMAHRIREAMRNPKASPIGGANKVVESDETFVGGSAHTVHRGKPAPKKHAVHALVERGGEVRATHIASISIKSLRQAVVTQASRQSYLMTDEAQPYKSIGQEFSGHGTVKHSADEYVRHGGFMHVQNAEAFFAILKRGVYGTFHSISEAHLQRYVDEFAFRWNTRSALGIEDDERADRAIKGIEGKRLTYRRTDKAKDA